MRIGTTKHLCLSPAVARQGLIAPPVMLPHLRPSRCVDMSTDGPVRNIAIPRVSSLHILPRSLGTATSACGVPLRTVADQLCAVATATRASALAAPAIGYDAHMVVVKSGLDSRVLINPVITKFSQATSSAWDCDGNDIVYRVQRPRHVAVKYATMDGDIEEWMNLAVTESIALQRAMDDLNGVSVVEHVAPCVATDPTLYPEVVHCGLVSSMPRTLYERYKAHLSLLVDVKSFHRHLLP